MSKYSTRRESLESMATLRQIGKISKDMYDVIVALMDKTAVSVLRTYYKGPRWVIIHDEWVQLVVEDGTMIAMDDAGNMVLLGKEDLIDILDMLEDGRIYASACGRMYAPPFAPLRVDLQGEGGQNHERVGASRPLPRSRRRAVKIR